MDRKDLVKKMKFHLQLLLILSLIISTFAFSDIFFKKVDKNKDKNKPLDDVATNDDFVGNSGDYAVDSHVIDGDVDIGSGKNHCCYLIYFYMI